VGFVTHGGGEGRLGLGRAVDLRLSRDDGHACEVLACCVCVCVVVVVVVCVCVCVSVSLSWCDIRKI
jgi:hypothetical protein